MSAFDPNCELCRESGGETVWRDDSCRVVAVGETDYPGYCRVVWAAHVPEMTDLPATERRHLMSVVFAVEAALRRLTGCDKINLASLGNQVPHLHWHVIARHRDDRHFPGAIWGPAVRQPQAREALDTDRLRTAIVAALAEEHGGGL